MGAAERNFGLYRGPSHSANRFHTVVQHRLNTAACWLAVENALAAVLDQYDGEVQSVDFSVLDEAQWTV
jgi:hypothetical protein